MKKVCLILLVLISLLILTSCRKNQEHFYQVLYEPGTTDTIIGKTEDIKYYRVGLYALVEECKYIRKDYAFVGWEYEGKIYNREATEFSDKAIVIPAHNITLIATWDVGYGLSFESGSEDAVNKTDEGLVFDTTYRLE
jgi:hypothetical protein